MDTAGHEPSANTGREGKTEGENRGSDRGKFSRPRTEVGGAEEIRTPDPHNAIVVLYQLSYDPNQSVRRAR